MRSSMIPPLSLVKRESVPLEETCTFQFNFITVGTILKVFLSAWVSPGCLWVQRCLRRPETPWTSPCLCRGLWTETQTQCFIQKLPFVSSWQNERYFTCSMWLTSNREQCCLVCMWDEMWLSVYCTGMPHPANSTIFPPLARWKSNRGVFFSETWERQTGRDMRGIHTEEGQFKTITIPQWQYVRTKEPDIQVFSLFLFEQILVWLNKWIVRLQSEIGIRPVSTVLNSDTNNHKRKYLKVKLMKKYSTCSFIPIKFLHFISAFLTCRCDFQEQRKWMQTEPPLNVIVQILKPACFKG